jgi:hypothetical protein
MKITGNITDISFDFKTGKPKVTLVLNEKAIVLDEIDELRQCDKLSIELKKFRPRRSLDANAYCWVLLGKLAENQGIPVDDIYRYYIKQIGGNADVVCVKNEALTKLQEAWKRCGLGWFSETFDSKLEGCTNVILYHGSSDFDSTTMARFIDGIIQDCKAVGVETATPQEISLLKEGWK